MLCISTLLIVETLPEEGADSVLEAEFLSEEGRASDSFDISGSFFDVVSASLGCAIGSLLFDAVVSWEDGGDGVTTPSSSASTSSSMALRASRCAVTLSCNSSWENRANPPALMGSSFLRQIISYAARSSSSDKLEIS